MKCDNGQCKVRSTSGGNYYPAGRKLAILLEGGKNSFGGTSECHTLRIARDWLTDCTQWRHGWPRCGPPWSSQPTAASPQNVFARLFKGLEGASSALTAMKIQQLTRSASDTRSGPDHQRRPSELG